MMTPELKQDLDAVIGDMVDVIVQIHEEHGVPMGELTVSIDYDEPECECECECDPDGFAEPAPITTLEEFDVAVTSVATEFENAVLEAKEKFTDALELIDVCVDSDGLDETLLALVAAKRLTEMGSKLEAAFQV